MANQNKINAARFYSLSADQHDVIGTHWMGVFYHEGFGVLKNLTKAVEYLTRAAEAGNGQSYYQLYLIHSGKEGQSPELKDAVKAYRFLMNAIYRGATFFEEAISFFKSNYKELAAEFIRINSLTLASQDDSEESKNNIINMHDAFINELKTNFSSALSKDRLYNRPCGFLNDQQIWMVGVNINYLIESVLRFDHNDFMKAL